jgi:uncharacterized Rmd1/YagE family protein
MPSALSIDKDTFTARAILVGDRIDLDALQITERIASSPLTIAVAGGGMGVLFRYGAVVLFDVSPLDEATFLRGLQSLVSGPAAAPETEALQIHIDADSPERLQQSQVYLQSGGVERLQLVADILAKSVVIALYESRVAGTFARIEPFSRNLQTKGRTGARGRRLLKVIGETLLSEHHMIGRVEVSDKPDLLWERIDLEKLYLRLEDEFEIQERYQILERKLNLVFRTAQVITDMLQDQRTLRVEWYIVILILIEILLTVYQHWFAH